MKLPAAVVAAFLSAALLAGRVSALVTRPGQGARLAQNAERAPSASANGTVAELKGADRPLQLSVQFRHRLRVCNVYPSSSSFDVYHGHEKLTSDATLAYKTCREFASPIKAGSRLSFKLGTTNAGSFAVSDLPNNDAVLVLVIYRHSTLSHAVAFESHVFANLINAQIAVLDTYKGKAQASLRIQDTGSSRTSRSEDLRFNSVVAVNPGVYEVVAQSEDGEMKARQELVALNRENYIVIRCGVEAERGESFGQDLLVFPRSDLRKLTGSANAVRGLRVVVMAALLHGLALAA